MTLFSLFFAALAFATPEPNMSFSYVPNEGMEATPCIHKRIRDLPDWEVNCDGDGVSKRFVAHVIFRENHRPKNSDLEILYWVTQRGLDPHTPPLFHSTTARIYLKDQAETLGMALSQGVENDYATLDLRWKPGIAPAQ